jgi:hypothetical protein
VDPRTCLNDIEKIKFLPLPGLVQPVASRYTDCANEVEEKFIKSFCLKSSREGHKLKWDDDIRQILLIHLPQHRI